MNPPVLCSLATVMSCIGPSVKIVTISPMVGHLLIFSISLKPILLSFPKTIQNIKSFFSLFFSLSLLLSPFSSFCCLTVPYCTFSSINFFFSVVLLLILLRTFFAKSVLLKIFEFSYQESRSNIIFWSLLFHTFSIA
jgi:hypothetical protein